VCVERPQRPSAEAASVELFLLRFSSEDREEWMRAATSWLSPGECRSAARLAGADRRVGYMLGRATLRLLGAAAAGVHPAAVQICEADGKPSLADSADVRTSISHSGRLTVVASNLGVDVGVDVETVAHAGIAPLRLARRFFTQAEAARLARLPAAHAAPEFVRHWLVKEAVGKVLGDGILPALSGVAVDCDTDPARLMSVPRGPLPELWTVHELAAPGGDERIAVVLPAPAVKLGAVRLVTRQAFTQGML
jgi:4'-phosphopantetheinyl transferase